jgi:hypothetical protein
MWMEKLFAGVLRVLTPLGARYIQPSFAQRIYLLWIFRHFRVLPLQVLTPRQRRVIDAMCVEPIAPTPVCDNARVSDVSPFATDLSNAERRS